MLSLHVLHHSAKHVNIVCMCMCVWMHQHMDFNLLPDSFVAFKRWKCLFVLFPHLTVHFGSGRTKSTQFVYQDFSSESERETPKDLNPAERHLYPCTHAGCLLHTDIITEQQPSASFTPLPLLLHRLTAACLCVCVYVCVFAWVLEY